MISQAESEIDSQMLSKKAEKCNPIRESRKAKKLRQADKLKSLKKWGGMRKKAPSKEEETTFQLLE